MNGPQNQLTKSSTALSSVHLDDPDSVWVDEGGRSLGFFCKKTPVRVDKELIEELKEKSARIGNQNLRLCLHEAPNAAFHDMINLQHRGPYYRPHKHISKAESYHIIEGSMACFVFDEDGQVVDANILEPTGNLLYRVGVDMYHAVVPLTALLIYHECKPGPFLPEGDSIFASWSPDGNDLEQALEYSGNLLKYLGKSPLAN